LLRGCEKSVRCLAHPLSKRHSSSVARQVAPRQEPDMHYEFRFAPQVDLNEAEASLRLAVMACVGLFGEARTRMEVSYSLDTKASTITVDGRTAPGEATIRI